MPGQGGLGPRRIAAELGAAELSAAGWRLERLTDNGGEYRSTTFRERLDRQGVLHTLIRAGRPQTKGAVEALNRTILTRRSVTDR